MIANLSGVNFFGENATKLSGMGLLFAGAAGISAVWNTVFVPTKPVE